MGRRPHNKRPSQPGKDYPGCIWTLISLFNIHHGHPTQKLLSDMHHGNSPQDDNSYLSTELDLINSYCKREKVDGPDENNSQKVSSGMSSVRTLIEEEMSQEHYRKNITTEKCRQMAAETGFEFPKNKHHKLTIKKLKGNSDIRNKNQCEPVQLDDRESNYVLTADKSPLNFDLAAFLLEYYGQGHQWQQLFVDGNISSKADVCDSLITIYQKMHEHLDVPDFLLDKKWPMLVKALADLAQEITNQNVSDEKLLTALRIIGPKEFLNALNTDQIKEALLKLLHDPHSHKQIIDTRNIQAKKLTKLEADESSEKVQLLREENSSPSQYNRSDYSEIRKRRRYSFFAKKDKSNAAQLLDSSSNSSAPDTIVVLKPNLGKIQKSSTTDSSCSTPQLHPKPRHNKDRENFFSYKEIMRRIGTIFGENRKERHVVSVDGVLLTLAIECHDLVDNRKLITSESREMNLVRNFDDDAITSSEALDIADKIGPERCEISMKRDVVNKEIMKSPVEMQDVGEKTEYQRQVQASISKERMKLFQEHIGQSLVPNEGRDNELVCSAKCVASFHTQQFNQEDDTDPLGASKNNLMLSSLTGNCSINEVETLYPESKFVASMEEQCATADYCNEGTAETVASTDCLLEKPLSLHENEVHVLNETYTEVMRQEKSKALEQPESASSTVIVESVTLERTIDKPGKGSPVSVLDNIYFSEDITSPEHTASIPIEPQQLHFEDHGNAEENATSFCIKQARLMYIEAVLEASGLKTGDFSEKWNIEEQLVKPSLSVELGGISCYPANDEQKFLFDCVNEVLVAMQERYSRYNSCVYYQKSCARYLPAQINLVHEVKRILDWHLRSELPETIEQMVEVDLYCKTWTDLGIEIDEIVSVVWEIMFDDIMEEAVLEMWCLQACNKQLSYVEPI